MRFIWDSVFIILNSAEQYLINQSQHLNFLLTPYAVCQVIAFVAISLNLHFISLTYQTETLIVRSHIST